MVQWTVYMRDCLFIEPSIALEQTVMRVLGQTAGLVADCSERVITLRCCCQTYSYKETKHTTRSRKVDLPRPGRGLVFQGETCAQTIVKLHANMSLLEGQLLRSLHIHL